MLVLGPIPEFFLGGCGVSGFFDCCMNTAPRHPVVPHEGVLGYFGNWRDRIAADNTTHGQETRCMRVERRLGRKRLADLEEMARAIGLITGHKTRGPKPR